MFWRAVGRGASWPDQVSAGKIVGHVGAEAEEHEQQRGHSLLRQHPEVGLRADQAFIAV